MKSLIAVMLGAALAGGCAAPYAPQEFDFTSLHDTRFGTVELVRPAQPAVPPFAGVFELVMYPEPDAQLLIQLDDGGSIEVIDRDGHHFEPGQRVRVISRTQVERE